ELRAGRLLSGDVDDVVAVEPSLVSEEGLHPIIMILGAVLELPGKAAVGQPRDLGPERPAGEGARGLAHVDLGVVAGAKAEQLQELTAPVLVHLGAVVL